MNDRPQSAASPGDRGANPGNDESAAGARRRVTSAQLLAGRNELRIEHNGEIYTLRITSKGRLILTK